MCCFREEQIECEGMNSTEQKSGPTPAMALGDVLYVVFRHKWMIGLISAAGFIGAVSLPFAIQRNYESEAKLFIRYVVDTPSPAQIGATGAGITTADVGGGRTSSTPNWRF